MTVAAIRGLLAELRTARNAGAWAREQNLWADLSEALDRLESDGIEG